jgi:hypothetical protein
MVGTSEYAYALVIDRAERLHALLQLSFQHPWVASYQIGFGPPLVRSSERLIRRVKEARSALEKLDAYLELCFLNREERGRLLANFRRLVVRRDGPVEAEAMDEMSASVLDLSLRLHHPREAPPAVTESMIREGLPVESLPARMPPEALTGRFLVKLADFRNERLLELEAIDAMVSDLPNALALELRVPDGARSTFAPFLRLLERGGSFTLVEIGDPRSHARVRRDGVTV